MTLWFDVEDLITHFRHAARPTGIQRLTFEIYREVWKAAGAAGDVRFCRHGATPAEYFVVDWPKLEAGILAAGAAGPGATTVQQAEPLLAELELTEPLSEAPEPGAETPAAAMPPEAQMKTASVRLNFRGKVHDYLYPRITATVREPLGVIYRSQKQTLLAVRDLLNALLPLLREPSQPPARLGEVTIRLTTEQVVFAPNDVFVALGASWGQLNAAAGRQVQKRYGLRFAVLIHDLIPELYPEWTSREGLSEFRTWLREVVPYADRIFAVSKHSAGDLAQRMAEWGKIVATPAVLPVGHRRPRHLVELPSASHGVPSHGVPSHGVPSHGDPASGDPASGAATSPFDRPFVLFVSTIEVRKNHALLLRVWRRLLSAMPAAEVPYLVFAGKVAWLTGDLMVQLENTNWLDGHIKLVVSPSEPELIALYETCAFTVFPSLYEGWGLPVTESLSFGKTVAASNRSAIPEAGGDFCCYYDPENVADAYGVIRGLIENPERVRQLEARIAECFRPPSWADTASVLLGHLQALAADAPPAGALPAEQQPAAAGDPASGSGIMAVA